MLKPEQSVILYAYKEKKISSSLLDNLLSPPQLQMGLFTQKVGSDIIFPNRLLPALPV